LWEWRHNAMKLAEEYCWTMTQAAGWSCRDGSDSIALEFGFQLDSLLYRSKFYRKGILSWLTQNSSWTGLSGAELKRRLGNICTLKFAAEFKIVHVDLNS
jgi:hypothetical protein